jgi:hypothetical protein
MLQGNTKSTSSEFGSKTWPTSYPARSKCCSRQNDRWLNRHKCDAGFAGGARSKRRRAARTLQDAGALAGRCEFREASGVRRVYRRFGTHETRTNNRISRPHESGAEDTALQTLARLPCVRQPREVSGDAPALRLRGPPKRRSGATAAGVFLPPANTSSAPAGCEAIMAIQINCGRDAGSRISADGASHTSPGQRPISANLLPRHVQPEGLPEISRIAERWQKLAGGRGAPCRVEAQRRQERRYPRIADNRIS